MTTTITRADDLLRDSVMRQLAWAPEVDASMVGVAAQDGVVTLSGYIDTYAARLAAERVSRNVFGVTAIADELEVRLPHERIDPEIARDAVEVLKSHDLSAAVGVTVRMSRSAPSTTTPLARLGCTAVSPTRCIAGR